MGEPSPERMSQEIDARIAARTRRMTGKEPDDDKDRMTAAAVPSR